MKSSLLPQLYTNSSVSYHLNYSSKCFIKLLCLFGVAQDLASPKNVCNEQPSCTVCPQLSPVGTEKLQ